MLLCISLMQSSSTDTETVCCTDEICLVLINRNVRLTLGEDFGSLKYRDQRKRATGNIAHRRGAESGARRDRMVCSCEKSDGEPYERLILLCHADVDRASLGTSTLLIVTRTDAL